MSTGRLRLKVLEHQPCPVPWNEMHGSERERHCAACGKDVHNFAAMQPKEIERLLAEKQGKLCARLTYRANGSIATLTGQSQTPLAAAVMLAASLAATSTHAQAPSMNGKAYLSGTVLAPDGSEPQENATVLLIADQKTIASTKSDKNGGFSIAVAPGNYDIVVWQNILYRTQITNAALHEGEQSLQPIRVSFHETTVDTVTGGELVATYHYPISYLFKHPLLYLKHLPHNFA
jgi:hypothetical protein